MPKYNVMLNDRFYKSIETDSTAMWLENNQWALVLENDNRPETLSSIDSIDIENTEDDNYMIVELSKVSSIRLGVKFIQV